MQSKFILAAFSFILALAPITARADVDDGTMIDAGVVMPLLAWVESQTGVHVTVMPTVIASHERLTQMLRSRAQPVAGRAQALYHGGMILLNNDTWDSDSTIQKSILVHELVHYAQSFMTHTSWACGNEKEEQAYILQNKWLEEHNERPFVNASWIDRVSRCSDSRQGINLAQSAE